MVFADGTWVHVRTFDYQKQEGLLRTEKSPDIYSPTEGQLDKHPTLLIGTEYICNKGVVKDSPPVTATNGTAVYSRPPRVDDFANFLFVWFAFEVVP